MKKLLAHMKSVYQIPPKIKWLTDYREKKQISHVEVVMAVLVMLILQYESFHTVFTAPETFVTVHMAILLEIFVSNGI